jgi:hypothetical protein
MPDIAMCTGEHDGWVCRKRETCYRHLAKPSLMQSYFAAPPGIAAEQADEVCSYYWDYRL